MFLRFLKKLNETFSFVAKNANEVYFVPDLRQRQSVDPPFTGHSFLVIRYGCSFIDTIFTRRKEVRKEASYGRFLLDQEKCVDQTAQVIFFLFA